MSARHAATVTARRSTVSRLWVGIGALLASLALAHVAAAQHAEVRLDVDRQIAQVGEPLVVTVRISIEGQASYSEYSPPRMDGFRRAGGGLSSQNISVVNWQVQRQETHRYEAIPLREGRLTIGPAAVRLGSHRVRSNTVSVTVRKGSAPTPPPASALSPGAAAPSSPQPAQRGGERPSLFLSASVEPRRVYVGQQVVAEWRLYTQSDVLDFRTLSQASAEGFWIEDLRSPRRLRFSRQVVDNRRYYVAVVGRKALFAQRAGQLRLTPMEVQLRTMDFFSSATQVRKSDPIEIEVLPLPSAGKPSGFPQQNVGRYEMTATLSQDRAAAGEAFKVSLVVRGVGNLRQLALPELPKLDGLKVYEPKVTERLDNTDGIKGEKAAEYLVLPTRSGTFEIPTLTMHYFDPATGRYAEAATEPLSVEVTGKLPGGQAGAAGIGSSAKNVLGPDIRPPRPARPLVHRDKPTLFGVLHVTLLALPLAALLVFVGGDRLRRRLARPTDRSLDRAAAKRVRQQLRRATELRSAGDIEGFYGALSAALGEQLRQEMHVVVEGLTRDELKATMVSAGMSDSLVQEAIDQLDACDAARFAPGAGEQDRLDEVQARVRKLVRQIATVKVGRRGPKRRRAA